MIANLVGPPASGKSTFAAKFVAEHPYFRYCAIDAYRLKYDNEDQAWTYLLKDMTEKRDVILESCGLDWRFERLLNTETIRRRPIMTISFDAPYLVLLDRAKTRQCGQRGHLDKLREADEIASIVWIQEHMYELCVKPQLHVNTNRSSPEEVYETIRSRILEFRLNNDIRPFGRRKENVIYTQRRIR